MVRKPRRLRKPGFDRQHLSKRWSERLTLSDGREFILRPICREDAEALREGFKTLTPEEVRFRFLHPIKELTEAHARALADIDPRRAFALVLREPGESLRARIGAVARCAIDDARREAEFAIVVGRELGGQGLGTYMLRKLIQWCRRKRLDAIYGTVLKENQAMLQVAERLGFRRTALPDDPGMIEVRMTLRESSEPSG